MTETVDRVTNMGITSAKTGFTVGMSKLQLLVRNSLSVYSS